MPGSSPTPGLALAHSSNPARHEWDPRAKFGFALLGVYGRNAFLNISDEYNKLTRPVVKGMMLRTKVSVG